MYPPQTGGRVYDAIIITSPTDITRYHAEAVGGRHELIVISDDGCTHVGDIHITVCQVCYSNHYVVFDQASNELSKDLELGFDCLADAITCLLRAAGMTITR